MENESESGLLIEIPKKIKFENRIKKGHIQFHFKCMECQLEFTIYSWYYDWLNKKKHVCCPECETHNTIALKITLSYKHIFEHLQIQGEPDHD